jgi:hypothetical protein
MARFHLGRTGTHNGYRAGTQNGSGISEEAAIGETSQRKLWLVPESSQCPLPSSTRAAPNAPENDKQVFEFADLFRAA